MTLPPEINSFLTFSGAGSAPMLEAATGTQVAPPFPKPSVRLYLVAGLDTGLANTGSALSGLFNITELLSQL